MEQLQIDWQNACQANTTKAYYGFLIKHPDSPYTEEAKRRIEETTEQRVFDKCVKDHDMFSYLHDYPEGRMLSEALEYKEKFSKQNIRRMIITSVISVAVLLILIFTLRDEYHTYNYFSSALIKFLILQAIVLICFDMRRWGFLQLIFGPTIIFFLFVNLSPKVEIITTNTAGNVRRALFYYVKDIHGNHIHVSGYNVMNNTNKTLYLTHLEYTKYSKKVIGVEKIIPHKILKTEPIDMYYKEPPFRLDMDVMVRVSRRGHTYYRTEHYEKRFLNVIDYQAHTDL